MKNANYCGHDFESVLFVLWDTSTSETKITEVKPMGKNSISKANEKPETSDINDYQDIINN